MMRAKNGNAERIAVHTNIASAGSAASIMNPKRLVRNKEFLGLGRDHEDIARGGTVERIRLIVEFIY